MVTHQNTMQKGEIFLRPIPGLPHLEIWIRKDQNGDESAVTLSAQQAREFIAKLGRIVHGGGG